jgi:RNA polymerase sigma factor (sigma-70 family)
MKADEKLLLDRVLSDEPGAFDDFLERYRALIYSVFYGKGYAFPADYMDDVYQSFVLALANQSYRKLRAFQGRNNCSLATFLQVVASRFALDELRKWKRHPRGRGASGDDEEILLDVEDPGLVDPVSQRLDREQADIFHNLLFSLEWKRISVVLWVFRGVTRETVADVMDTSRANIDALYKRAKDQMTKFFAEGTYSKAPRETDPRLLTREVKDALRQLLAVPPRRLWRELLVPGWKEKAVLGLIMTNYADYLCSFEEVERLLGGADPVQTTLTVLDDLAQRLEL